MCSMNPAPSIDPLLPKPSKLARSAMGAAIAVVGVLPRSVRSRLIQLTHLLASGAFKVNLDNYPHLDAADPMMLRFLFSSEHLKQHDTSLRRIRSTCTMTSEDGRLTAYEYKASFRALGTANFVLRTPDLIRGISGDVSARERYLDMRVSHWEVLPDFVREALNSHMVTNDQHGHAQTMRELSRVKKHGVLVEGDFPRNFKCDPLAYKRYGLATAHTVSDLKQLREKAMDPDTMSTIMELRLSESSTGVPMYPILFGTHGRNFSACATLASIIKTLPTALIVNDLCWLLRFELSASDKLVVLKAVGKLRDPWTVLAQPGIQRMLSHRTNIDNKQTTEYETFADAFNGKRKDSGIETVPLETEQQTSVPQTERVKQERNTAVQLVSSFGAMKGWQRDQIRKVAAYLSNGIVSSQEINEFILSSESFEGLLGELETRRLLYKEQGAPAHQRADPDKSTATIAAQHETPSEKNLVEPLTLFPTRGYKKGFSGLTSDDQERVTNALKAISNRTKRLELTTIEAAKHVFEIHVSSSLRVYWGFASRWGNPGAKGIALLAVGPKGKQEKIIEHLSR
jgi:hypothetical protein